MEEAEAAGTYVCGALAACRVQCGCRAAAHTHAMCSTSALTHSSLTAAHAYTAKAIQRAVLAGCRSIEHGNRLEAPTAGECT